MLQPVRKARVWHIRLLPSGVANGLFVLTSDVVNRAATFGVYALVARYRGATEVGQLAVALALLYTCQVFAAAGVRTAVTRGVAKDPGAVGRYLLSGAGVVTIASGIAFMLLAGFAQLVGYSSETRAVILMLGLSLLPFALSAVCEAVFQACDRMRYIAYSQVPVNLLKLAGAYMLVTQAYGIREIALLLLTCQLVIAAVQWWLVFRYVARPRLGDLHGAQFLLAFSGGTFLGIDCLIALSATVNTLLLSVLVTEREVGLYSAATQLLVPITLVYQSAAASVFPVICRKFETGATAVGEVLTPVLTLLIALALPTAVGLAFIADVALLTLYGNTDFLRAAAAVRILAWTLIPAALTAVLGQVLFAGVRERLTLRIVAVDTVVGLAAGIVFITWFGLVGAAVAAVITKGVDLLQHYRPVSRLVPLIPLQELAWKSFAATICMAVYLSAVHAGGLAARVAYAGVLYSAVFIALSIWAAGGPRQIRAKYLRVWLD